MIRGKERVLGKIGENRQNTNGSDREDGTTAAKFEA